ncbi:MAG: EAL domain-containing protein [Gammaproteobacteria bacterium]|nr:EAL domain-containing protein [Gammaproteobacteria bacterium]MDH5274202.1 EAL domain-containing protein [Gammaproteobacteria bacterium]
MDAASMFWLARQPILDLTGNTVAYELLFRSGATGGAQVTNDRTATATVISHAFNELGLAAVLGQCQGFINFDAELLMSDVVELLPPERTMIELLETVEITEAIVERCRNLRARGFSFALDDIVQLDAMHAPILPLVDVIKVDVKETPFAALPGLVARVREHPSRLKLLAEKVDSIEQADHCRQLGFELFQGYFFARPVIMQGRRADPSRSTLLHLLQQSMSNVENPEIEATFKQAPELSYKLVRLVNSVGIGGRHEIRSLAHALVILGRRQLQRWLQVLLFAHGSAGDFPSPLLQMAAARGKFLELLSDHDRRPQDACDLAFMTGILSLLDTLLKMPMAEALGGISLPQDARDALLERKGRLGKMLLLAEALERSEDAQVSSLLDTHDLCSTAILPRLQIAALSWSAGLGTFAERSEP